MGRALILLAALVGLASPATASNATPWMNPQVEHPTPWGFLDFNRAQGSAQNWERAKSLTGDWGGWRSRLEQEYGLFLLGTYTSEVAGNPVGGRSQGVTYTHNIGLALIVDLEKAIGLPGTRFITSASNRAGSSLSRDDI